MRNRVERVLGFLFVVATFLGGIVASGRYILANEERQQGALALAIGLALTAVLWLWVTKDRGNLRQPDTN